LPTFDDSTTTTAPVEEVWKLLYDPARIPEWWEGVAAVEPDGRDGAGDITMYTAGDPEFPMPQNMRADPDGRRLTISCLVSELVFEWRLEAFDNGTGIAVHVEIPEEKADMLELERGAMSASLRSLAALAAATGVPRGRG
jgi:uncharacterized protein YndB with AHSA1/START domain